MIIFLSVLLVLVCLLTLLLTFFQEGEGGVLGSESVNAVFNVKSTNRFLERVTFVCFAAIVGLSLTINYLNIKGDHGSILDKASPMLTEEKRPEAPSESESAKPSLPPAGSVEDKGLPVAQ